MSTESKVRFEQDGALGTLTLDSPPLNLIGDELIADLLAAIDAVEQAGKDSSGRATHFVIGVDSNQNMVKPGFVLTSMVKRVDNAVYDIVKDVVNHRFQGGFHVFGLDTEGVGYVVDKYNQSLVAPQTMQAAEDAKKKIVAGQIKVVDRMTQ